MPAHQLFITGLHRSGTTLLEKLVHNHPQASVASQPAPFLYYHLKQTFLKRRRLTRKYPIDPLFPEEDYRPIDFCRFLQQYELQTEELHRIFERMQGYEGQYSPDLLPHANKLEGGYFVDIYKQICSLTRFQASSGRVKLHGTKEIIGEEFIPMLAEAGVKCLLVLRDPRDMLLSTNAGNELGEIRPTLYYLRMWRKSVSFAIALQQHPNAMVLRYEDLVQQPKETLEKVAGFLKINPFPVGMQKAEIVSQTGDSWKGNSAFGKYKSVNTRPVGRYKKHFSAETTAYVEAFCYPEMKLLGYNCDQINDQNYQAGFLAMQRDPFTVTHPNFLAAYSNTAFNIGLEVMRLNMLRQTEPISGHDADMFFIFEKAYEALHRAVKSN